MFIARHTQKVRCSKAIELLYNAGWLQSQQLRRAGSCIARGETKVARGHPQPERTSLFTLDGADAHKDFPLPCRNLVAGRLLFEKLSFEEHLAQRLLLDWLRRLDEHRRRVPVEYRRLEQLQPHSIAAILAC